MLIVAIVFLVLLFAGMPVAFTIALSGTAFFIVNPHLPWEIIVQRALSPSQSFTMLAIPLFIFAGNLMNKTGITSRLIKLASVLTGHMYGSIAQLSCLLSMFMSGVSGSAVADATMQTRVLGPDMIKRGYPKPYIAALNGFTALIVATIPPSIGLIIYGSVGEVSIGRLFVGGFIPGFIMLVFFMLLVRFTAKRRSWVPERSKRASLRETGRAFIDSIWALLFPIILIVGLRFGLFTPSESGAFACVYAILVGMFIYKELTPKIFLEVLMDTGKDIGTIMLLISFSGIFGYGIVIDRVPQSISGFLMGINASQYVMMFMIVGVLLLIGTCIETTIIALLMTPILLPVAVSVGADPVQFGLIMMTTTTMAIMTPPMGVALFATSSTIGCKIEETVKESLPFIAVTLSVVTIMIFFPDVVLFIPNLVFGK